MEGPDYPEREFFELVGRCVKEWATIEVHLYDVCRLIFKADPKHVAIVYYRTPTISGRLALAESLVATLFPQRKAGRRSNPKALEWTQITKDLRPLLKIRNLLAHAPVGQAHQTEWIEEAGAIEALHTRFLFVTTGRPERLTGKTAENFDHPELPDHLKAIKGIGERLEKFSGWLEARARRSRRAKLLRRKVRQKSAQSPRNTMPRRRLPRGSSRE